MPKTKKQSRGEIVHDLRRYGKRTIPQAEFEATLREHDVTSHTAIRDYTRDLIEGQYLSRVEGGFQLNDESLKEGIITIRVTPSQHRTAVMRSLDAALTQFRPLVTMEIEA